MPAKGVVVSDVTEGACGAEPNGRAVPLAPQMGVIQGGLVRAVIARETFNWLAIARGIAEAGQMTAESPPL